MLIRIKYFARYREILNCSQEDLQLEKPISLKELLILLSNRGEQWEKIFSNSDNLLFAINQELAKDKQVLCDDDEVAFYPPVTGG